MSEPVTACPGCGLRVAAVGSPVHQYFGASAACWALYGLALERAYAGPECRTVLPLTVDAYACKAPR